MSLHGPADPAAGPGQEDEVGAFRASRDGVTARFAGNEANLIRDLVRQVAELVDEDGQPDVVGASAAGTAAASGDPGTAGDPGPGPDSGSAGDAARPRDTAGPGGLPGMAELEALLAISGNTELPDDPVLARLLPDAYQDDPESAGDFRRFTESSLRSAKVAAARTVLATLPAGGGRIRLSREHAEEWLRALNDVRLALGVRLGVTDNLDAVAREIKAGDPRLAALWVCDWLGQLQMSLVTALS